MTRSVSILGDSISTFEGCNPEGFAVYYTSERAEAAGLGGSCDTWWSLASDELGFEVLVNGSYSGSMVEGAGFPAGSSMERAQALELGDKTPDVVLIFLGINDYGWGGAAAQASGRSAATPPCTDLSAFPPSVAGLAQQESLERFEAAYTAMLGNIRSSYPAADVWCCTLLPGRVTGAEQATFAWRLRGISLREYNDAIRRSAKKTGCHVADTCAFGLDYEAIDGTHPTKLGMRQIASLVVAAVNGASQPACIRGENPFGCQGGKPDPSSCGEDRLNSQDRNRELGPWASAEFCDTLSCVDCPDARGAGNAWYCVCEARL